MMGVRWEKKKTGIVYPSAMRRERVVQKGGSSGEGRRERWGL